MLLNCDVGEDSWESLWTVRRSNQSILKEINSEYSLQGLMLKLKLQCFGHLIWRADLLEKTLMLGKVEGGMRRGTTEDDLVGWHHHLNRYEFEQAPGDVKDRELWHAAVHGVAKSWTRLSDWTATTNYPNTFKCLVFIYTCNCTFMGLSNLPSFLNIFMILAFFL